MKVVSNCTLFLVLLAWVVDQNVVALNHNTTSRKGQDCTNSSNCPETMQLFPLNAEETLSSISTFVIIALASGGGIGGGGLLVPLYMVTLSMTPHDAIPLSKATIFGGAVASFILNFNRRHPKSKDRALIDYEIVMMLEPMTLAGTVLGVYLNAILPRWIITLLLVLLTIRVSQKTFRNGKALLVKENQRERRILEDVVIYWQHLPRFNTEKELELCYRVIRKWKTTLKTKRIKTIKSIETKKEVELMEFEENVGFITHEEKNIFANGECPTLEDIVQSKKQTPWNDLVVLMLTWGVLFLMSILKGGNGAPSVIGLECGGAWYWSIFLTSIPFFVLVTSCFARKTVCKHNLMASMGYRYIEGEMRWTRKTAQLYPAICCTAGIGAGMLGIGGGMVQGPLFLHMGLCPEVASATSSTMILFTSSATTLQYVIFGMVKLDYVIWYGSIGFLGGIVGQIAIDYVVRKYRKSSYIIFPMAVVIGLSGIVMGALGIEDILYYGFEGFRSLCGSS